MEKKTMLGRSRAGMPQRHNAMKAAALAAAVCAALTSSAATTWYVDADNGNDAWNGQAALADAVPASGIGPKQTLAAFTNLISKGDTIYAAPGWYTNGVAETQFRFFSDKGNVSLISTGCATNTFIGGVVDDTVNQTSSPYGCGSKSIIPLKMIGNNNLVKGFTICNGRPRAWGSGNANYGGGATFSGHGSGDRLVDCVVTNCMANRGGGVNGLHYALRCRFTGNYAQEGAHAMSLKVAVNCIFENTDGYAVYNGNSSGEAANCLFRRNRGGGFRTNSGTTFIYNSVLLKPAGDTMRDKYSDFYNCLLNYDPSTGSEPIRGTNGECRVVADSLLKFTAAGAPTVRNVAVDAAAVTYYNNIFPSVFDASEKAFDIMGNPRTVGSAMDIGAVERQAETLDEWYVDAVNGDDSNSGRSAAQAFRTLARASTNALMEAGSTVYVAEGVYDQGVVPADPAVDVTANRMFVGNDVDFVATGRREATVVKGASDSGTASGIGPGAVRCCLMRSGSISGFTLQNGNVNANPSSSIGDQGGGVCSTTREAYVYDCEIHHCNAVRGGGAASVSLVRCYLHDNTTDVSGVSGRSAAAPGLFSCAAYNTVVVEDGVYSGTRFLNCTLTGSCWGSGVKFENCYVGKDGASVVDVAASFTNCVCAGAFNSFTKCDGCITNTPCKFNSKWRAAYEDSPLVNAGDYSLYTAHFPISLTEYLDLDFAGGARVIYDRIDIGAGEMKVTGTRLNFR